MLLHFLAELHKHPFCGAHAQYVFALLPPYQPSAFQPLEVVYYRNPVYARSTGQFAFFFGAVFSADSTLRFFFESILRVENLPGTEVLAFPLAFSVGALFGTGLLYYSLKDSMREFIRDCSKTLVQVLSASVLMGQMIYLNLQFWSQFLNLNTFTGIFFQGALSALLGMFVFFLVLFGLQSTELEEIMASWRRRFTGVSPVGDELESGASV